jgi:hypothetical protein
MVIQRRVVALDLKLSNQMSSRIRIELTPKVLECPVMITKRAKVDR